MRHLDLKAIRHLFEASLKEKIRYSMGPIELIDPMAYSLLNGGKRLRPSLMLMILAINSVDSLKSGLNTAIALEYIHTYSLIHDDLPAMDNDDYRRGVETNHKKFGEATAILAGDALLTDAFGLIAQDAYLSPEQRVQLVQKLSQAAGSIGMVAGQLADMQGSEDITRFEQLARIHALKTGKLFLFAIEAAGVILNLESQVLDQLCLFAEHFGQAYQIHNDLMDQVADLGTTGKKGRADSELHKATYPALLGLEASKEALSKEVKAASVILSKLEIETGNPYTEMQVFLDYLVIGEHDA